jgi:hypothetical protein
VLEIYQWLNQVYRYLNRSRPYLNFIQDSTHLASTEVRYLQQEEEPLHPARDKNVFSLDIVLDRRWENPILEFSHQFVRLLCQAERQDSVGQDPCQMGKKAFVDCEDTLRLHCLF